MNARGSTRTPSRRFIETFFKYIVRLLDQLTCDSLCDAHAPASYKIRDFIDSNIQSNIGLGDIANKFFSASPIL